ncbi:hypothetical protein PR048_003599 [Dryococelus australis]|uniref:Uncharacterized protein n=1 Tax=Dryococelus australis TaxID=614101 RepID=A0ABQ9IPT4_9NEOP|nr:hypothetical protein PR048_003599 [Dryococelus australis]
MPFVVEMTHLLQNWLANSRKTTQANTADFLRRNRTEVPESYILPGYTGTRAHCEWRTEVFRSTSENGFYLDGDEMDRGVRLNPIQNCSGSLSFEVWSDARTKGHEKQEITEKTRRPTASFGTIPTCENPVTQPGGWTRFTLVGGEQANRSTNRSRHALFERATLRNFFPYVVTNFTGRMSLTVPVKIHYLPKSNWAPDHNVCLVVVTPLESRRATSYGYNSSHPIWPALYECLQDIHGDSSPFLLQPFYELSNGFWPRLTSPHPAIQFVPKMFYWVEVGALGGPVQLANIVVGSLTKINNAATTTGNLANGVTSSGPTLALSGTNHISMFINAAVHVCVCVCGRRCVEGGEAMFRNFDDLIVPDDQVRRRGISPEAQQTWVTSSLNVRARLTVLPCSLSARGGVVVRLPASCLREPVSIPCGVAPEFSQLGIVPGDAAGRRRCSILASLTLIGSQHLAVKSRPNLFTHSDARLKTTLKFLCRKFNRSRDDELDTLGNIWPLAFYARACICLLRDVKSTDPGARLRLHGKIITLPRIYGHAVLWPPAAERFNLFPE